MTRLIWPLVVAAFIAFSVWLFVGPFPHLTDTELARVGIIACVGLAILAIWANRK